jgi:hypothetical protein
MNLAETFCLDYGFEESVKAQLSDFILIGVPVAAAVNEIGFEGIARPPWQG